MLNSKKDIVNALKKEFIDDDNVYAFWLEGADAMGTADEFSDIDMWFDVEDGYEDLFIEKFKLLLKTHSPFDFYHEKKHNHPKIRQIFAHLQGTSEFLIIDLCIQSHSRKIDFIIENKDEKAEIIFDKEQIIKYVHINESKFEQDILRRKKDIEKTFDFFAVWVQKEINRGNFLEALNCYHEYILSPLVEYIRIKYNPFKKDFGLKHIKLDLPEYIVEKLEYFHKVESIKTIKKKTEESAVYFKELME